MNSFKGDLKETKGNMREETFSSALQQTAEVKIRSVTPEKV